MNFIGFRYPITKTPHGLFAHQSDTAQIKSDLLILLQTNPGDRVFLPSFGTPLRQLLFEQNTTSLVSSVKQVIANAITQWEPRVAVTALNVSLTTDPTSSTPSNNSVSISISFLVPGNQTQIENLILELPLPT